MAAAARITDPDQQSALKMARRVGIRVAILSAVMVLAGVMLLFSLLWVDDRQRRAHDPRWHTPLDRGDPGLSVRLDPDDLLRMLPIVSGAIIVLAGGGAMIFARQAVKPLEDSMRRQRHFIGDASHELRTPLAVLDARIQHAQIVAGDNTELQPILADLRSDSRAMTGIVNDLLAAVSDAETDFAPADLSTVTSEVAHELRVLAEQRGVRVHVTGVVDPMLRVTVPETALRRSVLALGDNAITHTPAGGSVTFDMTTTGRWALLRVSDTGTGIVGIQADRVFERFARGTPHSGVGAADVPRSSHGIGLALVHDVAIRHGGSVAVERSDDSGTVFRLRLPIAREREST